MERVLAMGFTLFGAVVAFLATASIVPKNRKKGKFEINGEYTHNSMTCSGL